MSRPSALHVRRQPPPRTSPQAQDDAPCEPHKGDELEEQDGVARHEEAVGEQLCRLVELLVLLVELRELCFNGAELFAGVLPPPRQHLDARGAARRGVFRAV